MKVNNLKIGDSFEVVEVLDNWGFSYLKGKQGIIIEGFFKTFYEKDSHGAFM